jgi:hypothetical protein
VRFALGVVHREGQVFAASMSAAVAAGLGPLALFSGTALNPYAALTVLGGTALTLPVMAVARRYMHGDRALPQTMALCALLNLGFSLVATAPSLAHAGVGWSLFGFASTFLIATYPERPTVINNATCVGCFVCVCCFLVVVVCFCSVDCEDYGTCFLRYVCISILAELTLPVQTPAPRFLRLRTAANDAGIAKKHRVILPPCLPVPHRRSAEWVVESGLPRLAAKFPCGSQFK